MIAWEESDGTYKPIKSTDETVHLEDGKGGHAIIQYKPPDEPNKGLGYRIYPSGNQKPHYEATLDTVKGISTARSERRAKPYSKGTSQSCDTL